MVSYYSYQELRAKAIDTESPEDLEALGEWFIRFGDNFWNGESYDMGDGNRLYPVCKEILDETGNLDYCEIIGWEVK